MSSCLEEGTEPREQGQLRGEEGREQEGPLYLAAQELECIAWG